MAGIFYGVGVGPGDPGLLTLKAKQILEEADVIAVPVKKPGEKSTAFEIIRQVVETEGKEILETVFYMTADPSVWRSCAKEAAALVEALAQASTAAVPYNPADGGPNIASPGQTGEA